MLTAWPWKALAYLGLHILTGWIAWLAAATLVLIPAWAHTSARVHRRALPLTGAARIEQPADLTAALPRDIAHLLITALVAFVGTILATCAIGVLLPTLFAPLWLRFGGHITLPWIQVATPLEQGVAVLIGLALAVALLWGATLAAVGLSHLNTIVLSPSPAQLRRRLTAMTRAALAAQDALALERRELERQLHDGAQLHISVAATRLGLLELNLLDLPPQTRDPLTEHLTAIRDQLEAAQDSIRATAHGLIPRVLTDQGLCAALHALTAELPLNATLDCDLPRLPAATETGIYLILTEAITNTLKHAHATTIDITAHPTPNHGVQITVTDNGDGGIDPDGSGVMNMTARATTLGGTLDITSPHGGPSTLTLHLPGILDT